MFVSGNIAMWLSKKDN